MHLLQPDSGTLYLPRVKVYLLFSFRAQTGVCMQRRTLRLCPVHNSHPYGDPAVLPYSLRLCLRSSGGSPPANDSLWDASPTWSTTGHWRSNRRRSAVMGSGK